MSKGGAIVQSPVSGDVSSMELPHFNPTRTRHAQFSDLRDVFELISDALDPNAFVVIFPVAYLSLQTSPDHLGQAFIFTFHPFQTLTAQTTAKKKID
jgi:hypothetical protein